MGFRFPAMFPLQTLFRPLDWHPLSEGVDSQVAGRVQVSIAQFLLELLMRILGLMPGSPSAGRLRHLIPPAFGRGGRGRQPRGR
jgi:hypothetical protein